MPQKVTFTSVEIDHIKRTMEKTTARFQFPLTKSVIAQMGWGELADYETASDLSGDLAALTITLNPTDVGLKRMAIDLDAQRVFNFKATKQELEGKRGKGSRWLVQCDAILRDNSGCRKIEAYMQSVPKSEMRVSYEPSAVQANIPGTELDGDSQEEMPLQ